MTAYFALSQDRKKHLKEDTTNFVRSSVFNYLLNKPKLEQADLTSGKSLVVTSKPGAAPLKIEGYVELLVEGRKHDT